MMIEPKLIAGKRILPIMATEVEYGAQLKTRFTPFICGVGPVEAAALAAARLTRGDVDLAVSLGSAGSATLPQGSVHQVARVSYRDMDATALGFPAGVTPMSDAGAWIDLDTPVPNLQAVSLATGASVVSGEAYAAIDADMVDMETWALARACHHANVPLLALRGVSDGSEPLTGYADWAGYLDIVDQALAQAWDALIEAL